MGHGAGHAHQGLATSEASQTMAWMSRPCPTSMNHITTGPPCNGRPTRWKSMGWRASCMRPMCPWCDRACATYSWRAIIWTPWCSRSTIACFHSHNCREFEDAWLRTTARERQKETEKDEKYVRITCGYTLVTIWEYEWVSLKSNDPYTAAGVGRQALSVTASHICQCQVHVWPAPGTNMQALQLVIHKDLT